jgi:ABC-2 type transport system permease protein/sodium transport system permease protein
MKDATPSYAPGLGRLWRLTRKELSESLRDRRTLGTLVLMPVLLYPVLAIAFMQLYQSSRVERARPGYRLGFVSHEEAASLLRWWSDGRIHMLRRHAASANKAEPPAPADYLKPMPELEPVLALELEEAVSADQIDVGVRLRPPGGFTPNPRRQLFIECDLVYREGSAKGREAVRHLEILTADANAWLVSRGLRALRIPQRGDPVRVHARELPDTTTKKSSIMPVLVPLILILMTMTGAVYPAIDLTAGERERGTLEVLVAAPVPRLLLLLAKYAAVFTVAMLTAVVNLGSMTLTLRATGIQKALFGTQLGGLVLIQIFALLLLFAAFFSAVVLTLTSFARSFKEAQAYLIPLMLLCLTPGVMALMPGLSLNGPLAVVPLLNIVLLARDLLAGTATLSVAVVVVATTLVYALAAVSVAARFFGAEAVLSSDVSGWSDLFRRPSTPQPAADATLALVCLALMFQCYFLVMMGMAQVAGLSATTKLGVAALVSIVLFVGFPLAFGWLGRVRLADAFCWRVPSWQACTVAVLLGACLWPLVHEVIRLERLVGIGGLSGMSQQHQEKITEMIEQWRQHSPLLIVAVMALVPAVVEELFFRGFLFTALLGNGARPGRAVLASAALFAAFHLLVGTKLTVERFVPSFLLGVVLGWLCLKSGSIVPGMILHALHNGLLVLMGYYQPLLAERGWVPAADERLPAWLLGAAAAGTAVGVVWVWGMGRRGEERE